MISTTALIFVSTMSFIAGVLCSILGIIVYKAMKD